MADPVVGELIQRPYAPQCSQPGGPGTPVTPGILPEQRVGWFNPGCGHSIRHWDIIAVSVSGQPKKAITCPICGFVQAIKTQAEIDAMVDNGGIVSA